MHIVTTLVKMENALAGRGTDAPQRQIAGVGAWARKVADAVVAGYACGSTAGMNASPRRGGDITHRGFVDTCQAVIEALLVQQATAQAIYDDAIAQAQAAKNAKAREAALARAARAAEWKSAAMTAETAGAGLVASEDAILRPVGEAVAAAGGVGEVARDRHYHQGRGRR